MRRIRGGGVRAWIKWHLIYLRSMYRSRYICAEVGCPLNPALLWGQPTSSYCERHRDEHEAAILAMRPKEEPEEGVVPLAESSARSSALRRV
jgi:hypothetical protein